MKPSFFNRSEPAITFLTHGSTIAEICKGIETAYASGADAMAVELFDLPPQERTIDNYKAIMAAAPLPCMFILYRNDQWLKDDDDARQKFLLDAVDAGAEVVDVMGDLFQPSKFELATDPGAIAKQKALINEIHARGGKVVMSSHMPEFRTPDEILAHLQAQSERGADILKIVSGCNSEEELNSQIAATMMLNRTLTKPFIHLSGGSWSRLHRFLSPKLGSVIAFAKNTEGELQPSVRAYRGLFANMQWHINDHRP